MRTSDGGDHQISLAGRPAGVPTRDEQRCIVSGGFLIERQDASLKVFLENRPCCCVEKLALPPVRQHGDAGRDLSLANGCGAELVLRLAREPGRYRGNRLAAHEGGQDIGIEDEHQSKRGGSRAGSRGGKSRSMPPIGSTRARIRSYRLAAGCSEALRAVVRIRRASASME